MLRELQPGILRPLGTGAFARLFVARAVSSVGDGAYFVAQVWLVYTISPSPAALGIVTVFALAPEAMLTLIGGVRSDLGDRRLVLVGSDIARALAAAALGVIVLAHWSSLVAVAAVATVLAIGRAFFTPAYRSIIPDLLPRAAVAEANGLDQLATPLAARFAGPALGGVITAMGAPGIVFLFDAATFVFSACLVIGLPRVGQPRSLGQTVEVRARRAVVDGIRYLASVRWLWIGSVANAVTLLLFWGPVQLLVPLLVKGAWRGRASDYGMVLAMCGVGAIIGGAAAGSSGARIGGSVRFVLVVWSLGTCATAAYGVAEAPWQAAVVGFLSTGAFAAGNTIWYATIQTSVPRSMCGRVMSIEAMLAAALAPVSYLLTIPVASLLGYRTTLIAAGLTGGMAAALALAAVLRAQPTLGLEGQTE